MIDTVDRCSDKPPAEVVSAFIEAMHGWELTSWARSRQFRGTERDAEHWTETGAAQALIQATYLTPRRRGLRGAADDSEAARL